MLAVQQERPVFPIHLEHSNSATMLSAGLTSVARQSEDNMALYQHRAPASPATGSPQNPVVTMGLNAFTVVGALPTSAAGQFNFDGSSAGLEMALGGGGHHHDQISGLPVGTRLATIPAGASMSPEFTAAALSQLSLGGFQQHNPSLTGSPGGAMAGLNMNMLSPGLSMLQQPLSSSLYIKNLPPDADKLFLYENFATYGAILSVKVLHDPQTGQCRGVGFVNYSDHQSAVRAIQALHGTKVGDRLLHVSLQAPRIRRHEM